MLLAVMAGLASVQDERAAAVGARIEEEARTSMASVRRRRATSSGSTTSARPGWTG